MRPWSSCLVLRSVARVLVVSSLVSVVEVYPGPVLIFQAVRCVWSSWCVVRGLGLGAVLCCAVLSCPVLFCPVLSCSVLFRSKLSCSEMSCPVLFCPVLSLTLCDRFDAEQRGLMTDSGAVEDTLLDGFADPWPRPRYAATAAAASAAGDSAGAVKNGNAAAAASPNQDTTNTAATKDGGSQPSPLTLPSSAAAPKGAAGPAGTGTDTRLVLPEGVLLKHAVQVWNALCVFPRPMGLRPPPTLDQLMRAIVTLSPRWSRGGRRGGRAAGPGRNPEDDAGGGGEKEEGEGEGEGEVEFDDKKASIRGKRGGGSEEGGEEDEADEESKKEAQALLDGICMSIVRVLAIDLHSVLGR